VNKDVGVGREKHCDDTIFLFEFMFHVVPTYQQTDLRLGWIYPAFLGADSVLGKSG
jgi:hypothetical protein